MGDRKVRRRVVEVGIGREEGQGFWIVEHRGDASRCQMLLQLIPFVGSDNVKVINMIAIACDHGSFKHF